MRGMQTRPRAFKETQLFGWDTEPKEERPSEFQSTGFSNVSGYSHAVGGARRATPRGRARRNGSFGTLLVSLLAVIGAGAFGVHWLAQMLRG